jgi:hypothetical protein
MQTCVNWSQEANIFLLLVFITVYNYTVPWIVYLCINFDCINTDCECFFGGRSLHCHCSSKQNAVLLFCPSLLDLNTCNWRRHIIMWDVKGTRKFCLLFYVGVQCGFSHNLKNTGHGGWKKFLNQEIQDFSLFQVLLWWSNQAACGIHGQ